MLHSVHQRRKDTYAEDRTSGEGQCAHEAQADAQAEAQAQAGVNVIMMSEVLEAMKPALSVAEDSAEAVDGPTKSD